MACLSAQQPMAHSEVSGLIDSVPFCVVEQKMSPIPKNVMETIAHLFKILNACERILLQMKVDAGKSDADLMSLCIEAAKIRNALALLIPKIEQNKAIYHVKLFYEMAVSDWDDFVEELSVSSDPEILELTLEISRVVDAAAKSN